MSLQEAIKRFEKVEYRQWGQWSDDSWFFSGV